MKLTGILFCVASAAAEQISGSGRITGRVLSADGKAISGAGVKAYRVGGAEETRPRAYVGGTHSGRDGSYVLERMPAGLYALCASMDDSDLLDSCLWRRNNPLLGLDTGQELSKITIHLQKGFRLRLRLDDPEEHLDKNLGKTRGAGVHVLMAGPFTPGVTPRVRAEKKSQEYEMVVPFDTPVQVNVNSRFFRLSDPDGTAVSARGKDFSVKISKRQVDRGTVPAALQMRVSGLRSNAP